MLFIFVKIENIIFITANNVFAGKNFFWLMVFKEKLRNSES